jgi:hypothetical protein
MGEKLGEAGIMEPRTPPEDWREWTPYPPEEDEDVGGIMREIGIPAPSDESEEDE